MNTMRMSGATWSVVPPASPSAGKDAHRRSLETLRTTRTEAAPEGLIVDDLSREVLLAGAVIDVTKTEFDILHILASHPRQVFTARQLFQRVWSSHFFDADHVIETHISRLRRKLGESGTQPRYIHTVRGVGYRFEPQPSSTSAPSAPSTSDRRFHVQLTPDLTVARIDAALADLLGLTEQQCLGEAIADLVRRLTDADITHFTTRPVRDNTGTLMGIDLEI